MTNSFYRRYGRVVLLLCAVSLPVVIYGAMSATNSNENVLSDWLPEDFEETKSLRWFSERFGATEMMVVTWDGCQLDDPRVDQLAERLRQGADVGESQRIKVFERVFSGPEMLEKLTSAPFNLKPKQALARMRGWLVGTDQETTGVVVLLNKQGEVYRHETVDWIRRSVQEICEIPEDAVMLAGPSIDSVAIDQTSTRTIRPLNFLCWGICLVIAAFTIRAPRLATMMFVLALFCQYLSLAIIFYSGEKMNSILFMVASLVFVLCVSAAVHLVNYYREAVERDGLEGAPSRAVADARLPCWLAASTTALGMISLTVSHITPIFTFGVFAAIGVLCGLTVLMLALPSCLERWPVRHWKQNATRVSNIPPDGGPWRQWANLVMRYHAPIVLFGALAIVFSIWGVTRLQTTVNLHDMFSSDARVIRDYDWVQSNLGPMVPIEVVLHFDKSEKARFLERMQLVECVRKEIAKVDFVGSTVTAASFGPNFPNGGSVRNMIRRGVVNQKLKKHRDAFKRVHYLYDDDRAKEELWRISVRVEARKRIDYGNFMDQLDARIQPVLQEFVAESKNISEVRATLCGSVPLINKAQSQLLEDLMWSFLTAFILIGITMVFVLRSFVGGVLSMIPNIVPSVIVFGLMGWFDVVIDIGAMMTASVALGIAVDDTLHFIVWFRRGIESGYDRQAAIRHAFSRCATPMLQTSLICGLGLLGYSLSPFVPISRFSWLLSFMLFVAVLGDLVLLPAVLAGPLGRFFESRYTWRRLIAPLVGPVQRLQQVRSGT